jgi:hypothetical protein
MLNHWLLVDRLVHLSGPSDWSPLVVGVAIVSSPGITAGVWFRSELRDLKKKTYLVWQTHPRKGEGLFRTPSYSQIESVGVIEN